MSWLGPIVTPISLGPWAPRSFICACAVQTTTSVRRGRGLTGECARFVARSAHARVIRSVNTHASDIFGAASEWLMWGGLSGLRGGDVGLVYVWSRGVTRPGSTSIPMISRRRGGKDLTYSNEQTFKFILYYTWNYDWYNTSIGLDYLLNLQTKFMIQKF